MNDQLPLINCPSSSARQSEGFVNLRSWVQIPPRAHIAIEVTKYYMSKQQILIITFCTISGIASMND